MATLDQALEQMRAAGMPDFPPGHPRTNTDRIIRYGPKKKAWYRLYEYRARNGRYYVHGAYGMWGEIDSTKLETDWHGIDQDERERIERSQAELQRQEQAKRTDRALFASRRGEQQFHDGRKSPPDGVETYLNRKGATHEKGIRYAVDGTVLVPMIRYDVTEAQQDADGYTGPRRFLGLQKIAPDGTKRFNKGMALEGAACRLGDAPHGGELIMLTEGLATGLTLRMATERKYAVYVAFNAGNLPRVAAILRKLFPSSAIVFAADDDAYLVSSLNKLLRENFGVTDIVTLPTTERGITTKHGPGLVSAEWVQDGDGVPGIVGAMRYQDRTCTLSRTNAGRVYANRAAAAVGNSCVVYPVFGDRKVPPEPDPPAKLTDFNDLHKAEGLDVVRKQLAMEIDRIVLSMQVRSLVEREVKDAKKKAAKEKAPRPRPIGFDNFLKRFTLIYPTQTAWDAEYRQIVKVSDVELAFPGYTKYWLTSPERRTVNLDQVVFDPAEACGPECINLYNGMATKPSAGVCDLLLETIQYLCGEEGQEQTPITDYVLNWMAYPLQHPGAKMHTSIVMHGPEGTGKNMVWGALRDIYGEYGVLITQSELEDKFNGWMSRRLFVIANEVISRQELRHHVGRLKNYITEPMIPIREMFTPLRYEANHANAVFLTNETQPMLISPGDRRYTIVRTPGPKGDDYYKRLATELNGGGIAAFHYFLVNRDLGEFSVSTKPPLTQAKSDLIELGLSSAQWFQQQLHDGLIWPLRYTSCVVTDLYKAYQVHCARTGERMPSRLNRFSAEFAAMNGVVRRVMDVDVDATALLKAADKKPRKQATVFVMGGWPPDLDATSEAARSAYLQRCFREFRQELNIFLEHDEFRVGGADKDERDESRR